MTPGDLLHAATYTGDLTHPGGLRTAAVQTARLPGAVPGLPRKVGALAHYAPAAVALGKARTVSAEQVQQACEEIRP